MPKYQPLNLIGGFYTDDSLSWSAQDTVNWLPLMAEVDGTRTVAKLRTPPGLSLFTEAGDGPIRGAHNVEGKYFTVSAGFLFEVSPTGTATNRGAIPGVGRVSMAHNQISFGNQLTTVNLDGSGYVWNTVTNTLTKITDPGYEGSVQTDFLDGYMLHVDPFGRFWFHSALADALNFNTLDRYQSEASPDKIVGIKAFQSEVVVFSASTIEFFINVGGGLGQTFENKQIVINRGCASRDSIARINNTLVWLGEDGTVYALNGYREQRISTVPLEQAIAGLNWAQAFATVWESQGHTVYYLTFPDGRTWGYDFQSGLWTRRESFEMDRWRVNTLTFWDSRWIAGDFQNGNLYELEWGVYHENGMHLISERATGYSHSDQNRVICPYLELMFDTGIGSSNPLAVVGDVPDGYAGDPVTGSYSATGGIGPYTFAIISGTFPSGLTFSPDGSWTGQFSTAGSFSWVVQVTDAFGDTATLNDSSMVLDYWSSVDRSTGVLGVMNLTNATRDAQPISTQVSANYLGVRGTQSRNSGRIYVEFEVVSENATFNAFCGLSQAAISFDALSGGFQSVGTLGRRWNDQWAVASATSVDTGVNILTGDRIGILHDFGIRRCWMTRNGVFTNGFTPATNPNGLLNLVTPSGALFPFFSAQDSTAGVGSICRLHLKESDMLFFPVGAWAPFTAWGEN